MKHVLQSRDTGTGTTAAEIQNLAECAPTEVQTTRPARLQARRYELAKPKGTWVLLDAQTGLQRPYGLCTKEEAIRRTATFLRGRPGASCLMIRSRKGELQEERFYQGATEPACKN